MVNKVRNDSDISLLKCFHSNRSRGQITCVICPELRKNALFIDQSHASNFDLYTITKVMQELVKCVRINQFKICRTRTANIRLLEGRTKTRGL